MVLPVTHILSYGDNTHSTVSIEEQGCHPWLLALDLDYRILPNPSPDLIFITQGKVF